MDDIKPVFLYSIRSGKFTVIGGVIKDPLHNKYNTVSVYTKGKRYICANEPGIVKHETVWLYERDDTKARVQLLDYEISRIRTLEDSIWSHRKRIYGLDEKIIVKGDMVV